MDSRCQPASAERNAIAEDVISEPQPQPARIQIGPATFLWRPRFSAVFAAQTWVVERDQTMVKPRECSL